MTGAFDGSSQLSLVFGAGACLPTWPNFTVFGDETA
jgi:hypothetical protein